MIRTKPARKARRWAHRTKLWLSAAVAFHVACAVVLVPVASHPYDIAVLTGNAEAWLKWGFSPFYNWKFGFDYTVLGILAQALRAFLSSLGVPGIVALHVAWKLPLIVANLLTAGAIYRLTLRFAPDKAAILAALWLVNPAVLWISAGHGQIESLSVLCVFVAMLLALDRRLVLAGVVTGLGTGIEYFPLAAVGSVLIWSRGGFLSGRRPFVAYMTGLGVTLIACFAPVLVDPVGRSGIFGGLTTSSGLSIQSPSLLSIWSWVDFGWAGIWPGLFLVSAAVVTLLCWRMASQGLYVGVLFTAVILMTAVVLDVNALSLFALIAAAGLVLLAMIAPLPPLAIELLPALGASTALLWLDAGASNANAYFFDDWAAASGATLWPVPQSQELAILFGRIFSLGLVVAAAYALTVGRKPSRHFWTGSMVAGASLCALLVVWASQPAIWNIALTATPSANVPDFDAFVASRSGTLVSTSTNSVTVKYSDALLEASTSATVHPKAGLAISMRDLYSRVGLGTALPSVVWPNRGLSIPEWSQYGQSIDSVWIEVLLGSPNWSAQTSASNSGVALHVNDVTILPSHFATVAAESGLTSWALADFRVPAYAITGGTIELLPNPIAVLWNGSEAGPWVRIVPATGILNTTIQGQLTLTRFDIGPDGKGYALGLPVRGRYAVDLDRSHLPAYQVTGAVLRWPQTSDDWINNRWLDAIGAVYGLALSILCGYMLRVALRREMTSLRTPSAEGREASRLAPHWPSPTRP